LASLEPTESAQGDGVRILALVRVRVLALTGGDFHYQLR
jgi:hypothetical protein